LTVLYPSLATICGKNSVTDCRGTPRQISMARIIQLVGCLKILKASLRFILALTSAEESSCIRSVASFFSSSFKKYASAAECGRYQNANTEKRTVQEPSMMKRYLQFASEPVWMWNTPKASKPPKALAMD
jgi:hypothetical protein